ncbi:hypothetical protein S7711_00257 [Stachybotrys chartarum IBT 7711]|uniref:Uncharacterized protein n=1 Tax=Stachybotrys chartarum (strain CBS 109288 / IBT 7711) TaxID=1280523 RepID=A0A084B3X9_STACB|nr:hypothetical protein S7711_00257 [Stachybotrys chartarum IBT 7711]
MEPVAIIGLSFKLPAGLEDESSLWEALENARNVMSPWPDSRARLDAFYEPKANARNTMQSTGGGFLRDDPAAFDAPFFSITSKEAAAMDPQQRWLLETSYRALENAGIPLEKAAGTDTGVFATSMNEDYLRIMSKDPDEAPASTATGTSSPLLANRISWFFDLKGPSVLVNTACSSSITTIDLAYQNLQSGRCSMALVAACNSILTLDNTLQLSNMSFLSPDSRCYSFDHRANGYARGEGSVVLLLKRLGDAIRDKDTIRAVIRATGCNQDGHTPVLTQPSQSSQEQLIKRVYESCGLGMESTRYVEAHGTGTKVGDPTEANAVGRVFRAHRTTSEPLYIGSIKANIGHLEAASGLAGILKCILILERGIIPPNALFERLNPKINAKANKIAIPTTCTPWPATGLRRISLNSFGFGGSNAHCIMDDAFHTLERLSLSAIHCQSILSPPSSRFDQCPFLSDDKPYGNGTIGESLRHETNGDAVYKLLAWSAKDENALKRMIQSHARFWDTSIRGCKARMNSLARTLATRRSIMSWRSFAVLAPDSLMNPATTSATKSLRSSSDRKLAFVFTGQGAQYAKMGSDLRQYPIFQSVLARADTLLHELGADWSVFDELDSGARINTPQISQPLCTILQVALVDLLRSFDIVPDVVVGHSSGEIAAAYSIGALSFESACKIAYHRGRLAGQLAANATSGAMISTNIPEADVEAYLEDASLKSGLPLHTRIYTACVNSPSNVTLSGDKEAIETLKVYLDADSIFAHILNTGVAYHSPAMEELCDEYISSVGSLESREVDSTTFMVSSVTGLRVSVHTLTNTQYWTDNLVSTVRFSDALRYIALSAPKIDGLGNISDIVEVGPYGALKRPVNETISQATAGRAVAYNAVLSKTESPLITILEVVGKLFARGYPVSITAANQMDDNSEDSILIDVPPYPFDHSHLYWDESRISRDWRLREPTPRGILGIRTMDWNPLEPRWRKMLSVEEIPWMADHAIGDDIFFPAAGMIMMALEAVKQNIQTRQASIGYMIKEAIFMSPIIIQPEESTEVVTHLHPLRQAYDKASSRFQIDIFANVNSSWRACFKATISVQFEDHSTEVDGGYEARATVEYFTRRYVEAEEVCDKKIDKDNFYEGLKKGGLNYGDSFTLLEGLCWDGHDLALGRLDASVQDEYEGVVHPAVLDALFHICAVVPSKGGTRTLPTIIPHKMQDLWISGEGWQHPQTDQIQVLAKSKPQPVRGGAECYLLALGDRGKPLIHMKRLILSAITSNTSDGTARTKLAHRIEWKPHLSFLSPQDLRTICQVSPPLTLDEERVAASTQELKETLRVVVQYSKSTLLKQDWSTYPSHVRKYISWITKEVDESPDQMNGVPTKDAISQTLGKLKTEYSSWNLVIQRAEQLLSATHEQSIPKMLSYTPLIQDSSNSLLDNMDKAKIRNFLGLSAHQNPTQRILQIGANSLALTNIVLEALEQVEYRSGGVAFSKYCYANVSDTLFEEASKALSRFSDRLVFQVLDVLQNPTSQGFEMGTYDMVILSNSWQDTKSTPTTLQNIRSLLKPSGHLLMHDVTASQSFDSRSAFDILPDWWNVDGEDIECISFATESDWHDMLRVNGFTGNVFLTDHQSQAAHRGSTIISKVDNVSRAPVSASRIVLVVDGNDPSQARMADSLGTHLSTSMTCHPQTCSLDQLTKAKIGHTDYVIFLVEMGQSLLSHMSNLTFDQVKSWIQQSSNFLWVTAPATPGDEANAEILDVLSGLKDGFLRTVRSEYSNKAVTSLSLDDAHQISASCVDFIAQIVLSTLSQSSLDNEYVVRDGKVLTGRLIEDVHVNTELEALIFPQLKRDLWLSGPPLILAIGTRGQLETLHYKEDMEYYKPLGDTEVEIMSESWGLSFRDMFSALGRLDEADFGSDCAGVVTRVGSLVQKVVPGDRVCMIAFNSLRTYPRGNESTVVKIPDTVPFDEACAVIIPAMTSWHSLVEVARLKKGEKILIHAASGATGQLAIQVAQHIGAEVFATVGYDHKKQLLMDLYNIPASHIFYSRNTSFAKGIMRMTNGVDVVLNSLVDESLRASWECIAPCGRFVEIGKADINANNSLPMAFFAKNVSFSAVDIHHLAAYKEQAVAKLMHTALSLVGEGIISHPKPLHIYDVGSIEDAFRFFQSGKNTGRIVIRADSSSVVQKSLLSRKLWTFDPDSSYLIAGGLGGIGRSMLRWMASKGAKHLIALSRSGANSSVAGELVRELSGQGVTVYTPKCDASSLDSILKFLEEHGKTVPPIKGCINAAMVLNDSLFDNMPLSAWQQTISSKVMSSWNLHTLFPKLDFFIMLSSVSGIIGNPGQANYAAGCTFQDRLARYRLSQGQKALSIDLGAMRNIGVISESKFLQENMADSLKGLQVDEHEFIALLNVLCDPSYQLEAVDNGQITLGMETPADRLAKSMEITEPLRRPLYLYFSECYDGSPVGESSDTINHTKLFRELKSAEDRAEVVTAALAKKLARAVSMSIEDVDPDQPLHAFGVDSLVAVEIRSWISKEFAADIAVSELTGGRTITSVGELVTKMSQI